MSGQGIGHGEPGAIDQVIAALRRRQRRYRIEREDYLVLDSGLAQRLSDLAYATHQARASTASIEAAADRVVADLLAREQRLATGDLPPIEQVRLRITHDDLLAGGGTLPGPADLIVYPVHDTADSATRLTSAQVDALGDQLARSGVPGRTDLERIGVAALGATLAEPVLIQRESWRGRLAILITGDLYTASRVLDLPRLLGEVGIPVYQDVLVGVPSSRELWLVPLQPQSVAESAGELDARVRAGYAASRGQIAERAHLWSGGRLRIR